MVSGERCWSGPDVILRGTRHVHALIAARARRVMVVRRNDLDEDAEEAILVKAALASRHARRLKLSQVAALVGRLYDLYRRGKGFRSDLADDPTCVGANARGDGDDGGRRPDTLSLVARAAHEPRNTVANLRKIFGSPMSHLALRDAVDAGTLPPTAGADILREVEAEPDVAEVLKQAVREEWADDQIAENATIQGARTKVEARVREKLDNPPRRATPPANDNAAQKHTVEQPGQIEGDSLVMVCIYRARRTRVTVLHARVVRIEDMGAEAGIKKKTRSR
jgi:hypothetical protein